MSTDEMNEEDFEARDLRCRVIQFVALDFTDHLAEAKRRFPDFRVSDEVAGETHVKAWWVGEAYGLNARRHEGHTRDELVIALAEAAIVDDELRKAKARGCTAKQLLEDRVASGKRVAP